MSWISVLLQHWRKICSIGKQHASLAKNKQHISSPLRDPYGNYKGFCKGFYHIFVLTFFGWNYNILVDSNRNIGINIENNMGDSYRKHFCEDSYRKKNED